MKVAEEKEPTFLLWVPGTFSSPNPPPPLLYGGLSRRESAPFVNLKGRRRRRKRGFDPFRAESSKDPPLSLWQEGKDDDEERKTGMWCGGKRRGGKTLATGNTET